MTPEQNERFETLYAECATKAYRLALGMTGNPAEAEEVTQEAFFRAYKAFDSYRGDGGPFTWIYRITLNVAKDHMHRRSKLPVHALTEDYGLVIEDIIDHHPESDPEVMAMAKEARFKCLHCLTECMPDEQRKVFCLTVTLGLPQKTVAEILECSPGKVRTTLHRAKKRWFGYMEDRCEYVKRSNPCRCAQWVRFGLKHGWISRDQLQAEPEIDWAALMEVKTLKALSEIYRTLYPENNDSGLAERLREGIRKREWASIL